MRDRASYHNRSYYDGPDYYKGWNPQPNQTPEPREQSELDIILEKAGPYAFDKNTALQKYGAQTQAQRKELRRSTATELLAKPPIEDSPFDIAEYFRKGVTPGDSIYNLENMQYKFNENPQAAEAGAIACIAGHDHVTMSPEKYLQQIPKLDSGLPDHTQEAEIIDRLVNDDQYQPTKAEAEHAVSLAQQVIETNGSKFEPISRALEKLDAARQEYGVKFATVA